MLVAGLEVGGRMCQWVAPLHQDWVCSFIADFSITCLLTH